jgi:hypothetical protein
MQNARLGGRYLQDVLPPLTEVKVGKTWAETH